MKVILIQPPIEDFYDTPIRTYPLGLLYIATKIRDICSVSVLDFRSNIRPEIIKDRFFNELDSFYRDDISTPFSFFGRYYRFGLNSGRIRDVIKEEAPDVAGISSLFTPYSREALEIARIVKEVNKNTVTVMGGNHPTVFPDRVMQKPFVDFVVRGEGETPMFELMSRIKSGRPDFQGIPGLCYKKNSLIHIPDINTEPDIDMPPDRSFIDRERYKIGKKPYTFFLTSRGCPFNCDFCGKPDIPYRKRSIESIGNEIEDCIARGITSIDFEDDMPNLDKNFFHEVLKLCKGKNLTLSAMNGIYPHNMDTQTLDMMREAGFIRLNFSLVDISKSVLAGQKRMFPENFPNILSYVEDSSFLTEIHFIIGLPGQQPADLIETLIFLMERRALLGPSIFYLAPGSRMFGEFSGGDREERIKSFRSSFMLPVNPLFQRKTTFSIVKLVRAINYIKQQLDKNPDLKRLSDLPHFAKNPMEQEIVRTLVSEKRFIAYDRKIKDFSAEPQDEGLIRLFFAAAKGKTVKGFKTGNRLIFD